MPLEFDLCAFARGSITAPAGCGKTQLIADTLASASYGKPMLILTHTNAGAAALRARLGRAKVPGAAYRVSTIDGFSLRIITTFPMRSGHDPRIVQIANAATDYPDIRLAALRLLQAGHLNETFRRSYSRLIVDEYQDCSLIQHAMVDALATTLPTVVLGDPLQAIFGFGNNQLVDWNAHVVQRFPEIGMLQTPWRWLNAGSEPLGRWLLEARATLIRGDDIDLRNAPPQVERIAVDPTAPDVSRRTAAQTRLLPGEQTLLVIGDARNVAGRHQLTSQTPGATSVEAVDLRDLITFGRTFNFTSAAALHELVTFAASVMTQVSPTALAARVQTLRQGRQRVEASFVESAALLFAEAPNPATALKLLDCLEQNQGARVFRPELLRCLRAALRRMSEGGVTLGECVILARERNRHVGRPIARRSVGSTLLLKGLEADVAVILQPENMDARNLYVALTRGAKRTVICSQLPFIRPAAT